ncbi:MAG: hypothetical protein K2X11_18345 [Acetobacteraceae bacterium]|nr:hypothetical protein [Acetobacteraceae bacterium]
MMLPFNGANVSVAAALAAFALFLWIVAPYGALDCDDPAWRSAGPNGAKVEACARERPAAMGGQGSGFLILRDGAGWIRGVAEVTAMSTLAAAQASWTAAGIRIAHHAEWRLPAWRPAPLAFFVEAQWRVRAYLGLIPSDRDFR